MEIYQAELGQLLRSQHRDPLLRHLTRTIVELADRWSVDPRSTATIDIGCGLGRTSMALAAAGYPVIGVDPSPRAVALATRVAASGPKGEVGFYVGDATEAPPEAWRSAFDLAVCSEVIEHVGEPERVLDYARAVLRPGGVLVLTTPHDREQWTVMDDYAEHVTRFSLAEIRGLLAGFELLDLATEGFPFQRAVMQGYDRMLRRSGGEHRFDRFGDSPAYRAYTLVMPALLRVDHGLRRLGRGTTVVAVARREPELADPSDPSDPSEQGESAGE